MSIINELFQSEKRENFVHKPLYDLLNAEQKAKGLPPMTDKEENLLRKNLRKLDSEQLEKNQTLLQKMIKSGWYDLNREAKKMPVLMPAFNDYFAKQKKETSTKK